MKKNTTVSSWAIPASQRCAASKEIFSANLIYLMQDKGVLPAQLAIDLDISAHRLSSWLRQICYPTNDKLVALCDYFGYKDIYKLLTEKLG